MGKLISDRLDKTANLTDLKLLQLTFSGTEVQLIDYKNYPLPSELDTKLKAGEVVILQTTGNLIYHFYLPKTKQLFIISIKDSFHEKASNFGYFLTLTFYFIVLTLLIIWLYPLVSQLNKLRETSKAFGEGKLEQRVSRTKFSYISEIESEFNQMAGRIESLVDDVKLLSNAVSHDLRTPLARIRFGIDTMQEEIDDECDAKTLASYAEKVSKNIDEMTALVEALLEFSRLDQALLSVELKPLDLSELVKNNMSVERLFSGLEDPYNLTSSSQIKGNKFYLEMLINNLVGNAYHYGNGKILVSVTRQNNSVVLTVEDDGDGINSNQIEELLKPFIRGHHNNKHTYKGHGLGLAIVKRIADWHQAEIKITASSLLKGAKISIIFEQCV